MKHISNNDKCKKYAVSCLNEFFHSSHEWWTCTFLNSNPCTVTRTRWRNTATRTSPMLFFCNLEYYKKWNFNITLRNSWDIRYLCQKWSESTSIWIKMELTSARWQQRRHNDASAGSTPKTRAVKSSLTAGQSQNNYLAKCFDGNIWCIYAWHTIFQIGNVRN